MAAVIIVSIHPGGRWPLVYKCHTSAERKYYLVFTECGVYKWVAGIILKFKLNEIPSHFKTQYFTTLWYCIVYIICSFKTIQVL
jgi:hypothetical protein